MRLYTGNRRDANEHRAFFLSIPQIHLNLGISGFLFAGFWCNAFFYFYFSLVYKLFNQQIVKILA